MCGRKRRRRLTGVAVFALATAACFHTTAPEGWLSSPQEVQRSAFGAWASVQPTDTTRARVEGELIAVDRDSIHVLSGSRLVSLGMRAVRDVTLTTFDQPRSDVRTWMLLGTLSTASHGFFLVLTAPVWLIVGGVSLAEVSSAPRVESSSGVDELRKFARFPQGMPATLDRAALKPKWPAYQASDAAPPD